MVNAISRLDSNRALALFADWTDRIAAGELPAAQPQRPQGVERNVVISLWDWVTPTAYLHDEGSTDKRNPTVNANGLLYGSPEESTDFANIYVVIGAISHKHGATCDGGHAGNAGLRDLRHRRRTRRGGQFAEWVARFDQLQRHASLCIFDRRGTDDRSACAGAQQGARI